MKESAFQTKVRHYLIDNGAYVVNVWGGGGYQSAGVPDLLVCYNGIFLALELKVGYNKASERQLYNLEKINESKGLGLVFHHSDAWKEELDVILSALRRADISSIEDLKQTIQLPKRVITKITVT